MRERRPQLAYSEIETRTLDEAKRRRKAAKLIAVLAHFLGRERFDGLLVADLGCSAGYICDALADTGASVLGLDIDGPGLGRANERFGERVTFVCGDGSRLPVASKSLDVLVFNHIYEHVVDPDAVLAEIRRVLAPDGVAYLALGNRLGIMEPHHRLPFLSYLPPQLADRYVRLAGTGDSYYERYRTRWGLRRMVRDLHVWDYTLPVMTEPSRFRSGEVLPAGVAHAPRGLLRAGMPLVPTYVWVATPSPLGPRGPRLTVPPTPVAPP